MPCFSNEEGDGSGSMDKLLKQVAVAEKEAKGLKKQQLHKKLAKMRKNNDQARRLLELESEDETDESQVEAKGLKKKAKDKKEGESNKKNKKSKSIMLTEKKLKQLLAEE